MPAVSRDAVGVKLVTISPANPDAGLPSIQASYVVFDGATQSVKAVVDGAALTAIRTAAVSALATTHLAAADASTLVVFGAGVQASSHVDAMRSVRPIDDVVIVSRIARRRPNDWSTGSPPTVSERRVGVPERSSVTRHVICTCTTQRTPVFDGSLLADGRHVNAVGAYTTDARELDDAAVADAGIVVETREVAARRSG